MNAESLARGLNGRRNGSGWLCRCPVPGHVDKHPSLRINERDGKVLIKCWSGCSQGDVIAVLKHRGLWQGHRGNGVCSSSKTSDATSNTAASDKPRDPMKPWRNASPFIRGTPVDAYLKARGLEITDDEALSLRYAPLWHWPTQSTWPAMVAAVALADGTDCASHMTFVRPDGSGKAPIERPRLFAAGGKTAGAGVWFGKANPGHEFIVAEGVEFTLSAMRIFNVTAGVAALSAGGIRELILPAAARCVRIFPDHDELGQSLSAAHEAARRWRAEGRTVAATMSPEIGMDANDVWLRRMRSCQGGGAS